MQVGVLIGLGQCHFVLDGCPIPNRPSVTFLGEGHSWSLNILLPYIWLKWTNCQNRTLHGPAPSTSRCKWTITSRPATSIRVLASTLLDSKKYSSNVLVLEYSFNSTSGRKFQFLVPVFQINKQLLELYANLAPSPSSCDLRVASFAT